MMKSAACIIGAGYSFVGGLPLTKDLLTSETVVVSKQARQRFQRIWRHYGEWQHQNPSRNPEEYLAHLYNNPVKMQMPPFQWAVELLAAVLATPRGYDVRATNPRYGVRVTQPSWCAEHISFWKTVVSLFNVIAIVTTNYDLLTERILRHRPIKRSFGPGFYYGGLLRPQILKGTAQPFTVKDPQRFVELTGSLPLYKLHGSLSWGLSSSGIEMFQDMRPAFRHGSDAAIVPPISEKKVPDWLRPIWEEAEMCVSQADCWIVCGYSLPDYDTAIKGMLERASVSKLESIFLLDPHSKNLRANYEQTAPRAKITCLSGLPNGVHELNALAENVST